MKNIVKSALALSAVVLLSACAGVPQFPETGIATPYDGQWTAKLDSDRPACSKATTEFEIRYGHMIGTVHENGRKLADIWGQLDANGSVDGRIGQLGMTGAHAKVKFTRNAGTGTWYNRSCNGTVEARRAG